MFGLPKTPVTNQRAIERAQLRLFLFRHHREPSFLGRIPFASVVDTTGYQRARERPVGTLQLVHYRPRWPSVRCSLDVFTPSYRDGSMQYWLSMSGRTGHDAS